MTVFTDSNVLLYVVDAADEVKQRRASEWIEHLWSNGSGRLSWQVLHEFYWNATHKLKVPAGLARDVVRELCAWCPVDASLGLISAAWEWSDGAHVPYWDGLILAAAERCEADFLLSEDFQTGRRFGACTVVNPFQTRPADLA